LKDIQTKTRNREAYLSKLSRNNYSMYPIKKDSKESFFII